MELIDGIRYNYTGLKLGLKTPALLALGLLRFAVIFVLSIAAVWLVLANYQEIMNLLWKRPESIWIQWLWTLVSWVLGVLLTGISTILAFLLSQVLFSVVLMDRMSQITEHKITGKVIAPSGIAWFRTFFFLIRQEIPRMALPVIITLVLMIVGWFTPLSPISTVLSPLTAAVFLAWDNTDLVPARRLETFGSRFRLLAGHWMFHLGFGLWFLIPGLNIMFLSFAPVGATRYYIEHLAKNRVPGKTLSGLSGKNTQAN
jgi:CysZ protein